MSSVIRYPGTMMSRMCLQTRASPTSKVTAERRSFITHAGSISQSLLSEKLSCMPQHCNTKCQRHMSTKNLIQQFIENIKVHNPKTYFNAFIAERRQSNEMEERIAKFKQESRKLEESDALKQARRKFETVEEETIKRSSAVKDTLDSIKGKVSEISTEAKKHECIKQTLNITSTAASKTAETLSKTGQTISGAFERVTNCVKEANRDGDDSNLPRDHTYRPPATLRKRSDHSSRPTDTTRAVGDSQFDQSWQDFKYNKANRNFKEKLCGIFTNELSNALTEVCKIDQHFEQEQFKKLCDREIIPNVLEASIRGDLDVLNDWCYEASYKTLAKSIEQATRSGYYFDSKVLDVSNSEILTGKNMAQGPVLTITFTAQQIHVLRNSRGDLVEGDPNKIVNVVYEWDLGRDKNELDPVVAWKLLGIHQTSSSELFI